MTIRSRSITILLLTVLYLSSCTYLQDMAHPHRKILDEVVSWINANALDTESVLLPVGNSIEVGPYPVVVVPMHSDSFEALGIILTERPDYVLAFDDIVWDGVIQRPWFQQRYRLIETFTDSFDASTPAQLYGYVPSPFDVGEKFSVNDRFASDAPIASAYRLNSTRIFPGSILFLTVYWDITAFENTDDLKLTLQIFSITNQSPVYTIAEKFNLVYETFYNQTYVATYHSLALPENLDVGFYDLRILLNQSNGASYYAKAMSGELRDYASLSLLQNPSPVGTTILTPENPMTVYFLEGKQSVISLTGYDLVTQNVTGSGVRLGLIWHTLEAITGDYSVFVHIRDTQNNVVAQVDKKPLNWTYPTLEWKPGQYIYDTYSLKLEDNLERGYYTIYAGLYDAQTGQRVEVVDTAGVTFADGEIVLSDIKIR